MEIDAVQVIVKLSLPESATSYIRLQESWDNEGGAISVADQDVVLPDIKLPFHPGENLRVIDGHVEFIENQAFYVVTVERVKQKQGF